MLFPIIAGRLLNDREVLRCFKMLLLAAQPSFLRVALHLLVMRRLVRSKAVWLVPEVFDLLVTGELWDIDAASPVVDIRLKFSSSRLDGVSQQ